MHARNNIPQFAIVTLCLFVMTCISCIMDLTLNDAPAKVANAEVPVVELISKFSTYYGDSSANRKHNVALAASMINGTVLLPEEEFSFNDTVGFRTEARGFKTAYIISDGAFVEGVGGGVCQVSSTIYNCALLADLTISKVYPHSLPVYYVAPSFDAMVSRGSDLRFVNTLAAPITIKMEADGKYLRAEIYGVKGRDVRRRSETLDKIPSEVQYIDDPTLPLGEERVDSYGKNGLKSEGYLEYFKDGKLVDTVKIRIDSYKPQKEIVFRGTKSTLHDVGLADPLPDNNSSSAPLSDDPTPF